MPKSFAPPHSFRDRHDVEGTIDADATNKATLFEMAEALPGSKVLDGRWGSNATPSQFRRDATGNCFPPSLHERGEGKGVVTTAVARAGLRGAMFPPCDERSRAASSRTRRTFA